MSEKQLRLRDLIPVNPLWGEYETEEDALSDIMSYVAYKRRRSFDGAGIDEAEKEEQENDVEENWRWGDSYSKSNKYQLHSELQRVLNRLKVISRQPNSENNAEIIKKLNSLKDFLIKSLNEEITPD